MSHNYDANKQPSTELDSLQAANHYNQGDAYNSHDDNKYPASQNDPYDLHDSTKYHPSQPSHPWEHPEATTSDATAPENQALTAGYPKDHSNGTEQPGLERGDRGSRQYNRRWCGIKRKNRRKVVVALISVVIIAVLGGIGGGLGGGLSALRNRKSGSSDSDAPSLSSNTTANGTDTREARRSFSTVIIPSSLPV